MSFTILYISEEKKLKQTDQHNQTFQQGKYNFFQVPLCGSTGGMNAEVKVNLRSTLTHKTSCTRWATPYTTTWRTSEPVEHLSIMVKDLLKCS